MLNKAVRNLSENMANQLQDKMTTKFEWHAFSCESNHEFAIKIPVNVSVKHVMGIYQAMHCPLCESKQLTKQPNL